MISTWTWFQQKWRTIIDLQVKENRNSEWTFEEGYLDWGKSEWGLLGVIQVRTHHNMESDSLYLRVSILVSPVLSKNFSNIHFVFLGCKV